MNDALHSTSGFAAERYVLGELTADEREQFEEHFFSCAECADRVLSAASFVDNARVVLPELDRAPAVETVPKPSPKRAGKRLSWFPWYLAPEAALACIALLCVITVYQNAVQIPHLRASAASNGLLLSDAKVLIARRAASNFTFAARNPVASIVVAHEWEENYPRYASEIRRDSHPEPVMSSSSTPASGSLLVSIPAARLGPGKYTMILYGVTSTGSRQIVARSPFTIQQ